MAYKQVGYGNIQLIDVDNESMKQMYPLVYANCQMFLATHPELAEEMYNNPAAYVEEYNKCVKVFGDKLLNETQLFGVGGILMYQSVHIEILNNQVKELKEKLDRYENND